MIAHPLAAAGLVLNMVGAALLLRYPPAAVTLLEDGAEVSTWVMPATKRRHVLQKWGFRMAIVALLIGFGLQLIDLLHT
jgi:hypothetical protein